jgi:chemotaxis protein methyltransferase CheR
MPKSGVLPLSCLVAERRPMPDFEITAPVFAILSSLIEERVGISYSYDDRALLGAKVSARALDAGFETALDYYYYLRYDDPSGTEFNALIESLVVNETFFFRELDQLEMLISSFVVPRVAAGNTPTIWSAACSTGEEPLSVAMLLAQRGLLNHVKLIASDVSASALARAQSGRYGARSLRGASMPSAGERWLRREPNGVVIEPELVRAVDWRRLNLLDEAGVRAVGEVDFILLRNVLIYFADDVALRVVKSLTAQLRVDGALLVGVSESLMRFGTALACEEHGGVFAYRKVSEA